MSSNLIVNNIEVGAGATIYTAASNQLAFGTNGSEKLRITSAGRVGINTNNPTEILDVRGDLVVAESIAVNRPRIVLSAPNDGTNYRHLFGANLQVNSSGTFTTPTANISGGGWEYLPANSLNQHGNLVYLSAPDTNATSSTPLERFRITANGDIVTHGLTDHSFNNDNANAKILEMTGDGTVGEYGSINVSGNQNADGSNIGSIKFVNRENSNSSSSSNAGSRVVAGLQAYIETSDTNAGDDSGGYLKFLTKSESGGLGERLRIKSDGTVYTYTEGAKFGVSQDPTLTTMGSTSGTWQVPEVDSQTIGAEMRIGDINSNTTALIRLASYGSGNSGTGGGAIMFTNTRCGSANNHSDLAAIKGARESLGKGYLRFFTASSAANTEKMRITADGEVLIGGRSAWGSNQHPNDANKVVITGPTPTDTYRNILMLEGSETSGAADTGGSLAFGGHDGSNNRNWANIWGMKENGTGGNTAGYMAFHTRPAGGNPTEWLRITSGGKVSIGGQNASPVGQLEITGNGYHQLTISNNKTANSNKLAGISVLDYVGTGDKVSVFQTYCSSGANHIYWGSADSSARGFQNHYFYTNASSTATTNNIERVRITTACFYVNSSNNSITSQPAFLAHQSSGCASYRPHASHPIHHFYSNAGGTYSLESYVNGNGSYTDLSDYRLKENIVSISNGISVVKQLNPVKFDWKSSAKPKDDPGFIAHEVQALIPTAVDGTKDQVKEDGSPFYQGIAQTKIIPYLTAALKEAIAKIEVLETEVAALKSS